MHQLGTQSLRILHTHHAISLSITLTSPSISPTFCGPLPPSVLPLSTSPSFLIISSQIPLPNLRKLSVTPLFTVNPNSISLNSNSHSFHSPRPVVSTLTFPSSTSTSISLPSPTPASPPHATSQKALSFGMTNPNNPRLGRFLPKINAKLFATTHRTPQPFSALTADSRELPTPTPKPLPAITMALPL